MNDERIENYRSTLDLANELVEKQQRRIAELEAELAAMRANQRARENAAARWGWLEARDKAISLGLFSMRLVPVTDLPAD